MEQTKTALIIDLSMQSQLRQVENLISLLQKGIDKQEAANFVYQCIDTELDETSAVELMTRAKDNLDKLLEKARYEYQQHAGSLINTFFDEPG